MHCDATVGINGGRHLQGYAGGHIGHFLRGDGSAAGADRGIRSGVGNLVRDIDRGLFIIEGRDLGVGKHFKLTLLDRCGYYRVESEVVYLPEESQGAAESVSGWRGPGQIGLAYSGAAGVLEVPVHAQVERVVERHFHQLHFYHHLLGHAVQAADQPGCGVQSEGSISDYQGVIVLVRGGLGAAALGRGDGVYLRFHFRRFEVIQEENARLLQAFLLLGNKSGGSGYTDYIISDLLRGQAFDVEQGLESLFERNFRQADRNGAGDVVAVDDVEVCLGGHHVYNFPHLGLAVVEGDRLAGQIVHDIARSGSGIGPFRSYDRRFLAEKVFRLGGLQSQLHRLAGSGSGSDDLYSGRDRGRGIFYRRGGGLPGRRAEHDHQLGALAGDLINRLPRQVHHHAGNAHRAGLELAGPHLGQRTAVNRDLLERLHFGVHQFQHQPGRVLRGKGFVLHRLVGVDVNAFRGDPDGPDRGVFHGEKQQRVLSEQKPRQGGRYEFFHFFHLHRIILSHAG